MSFHELDHPVAVLSARLDNDDNSGSSTDFSSQLSQFQIDSNSDPRTQPGDYLLLVHGVNDKFIEARYFYALMRRNLSAYGVAPKIIEYHWPSNAEAFLTFLLHPGYAAQAAAMLADFIRRSCPGARFSFLSHSWGGEVVLRAVASLRADAAAFGKISGVCMMACAFPVADVENGNFGPQPGDTFHWRVLHSPADDVLRYAMTIGEAITTGELVEAVGTYGRPVDKFPESTGWIPCYWDIKFHPQGPYGHSCYWPSSVQQSVPSRFTQAPTVPSAESFAIELPALDGIYLPVPHQAADYVASFLGFAPPATTPVYTTPTNVLAA